MDIVIRSCIRFVVCNLFFLRIPMHLNVVTNDIEDQITISQAADLLLDRFINSLLHVLQKRKRYRLDVPLQVYAKNAPFLGRPRRRMCLVIRSL